MLIDSLFLLLSWVFLLYKVWFLKSIFLIIMCVQVVKENQMLHKGTRTIDSECASLADMNIFPGDKLWVTDSEIHEHRDIAGTYLLKLVRLQFYLGSSVACWFFKVRFFGEKAFIFPWNNKFCVRSLCFLNRSYYVFPFVLFLQMKLWSIFN